MRWLLSAAIVLHATTAAADEPRRDEPRRDEVAWHDEWPRFSVTEAVVSAGVTAQNLYLDKGLDEPKQALVEFYVPVLDKGARSLLQIKNDEHRRAAARL